MPPLRCSGPSALGTSRGHVEARYKHLAKAIRMTVNGTQETHTSEQGRFAHQNFEVTTFDQTQSVLEVWLLEWSILETPICD